MDGPVVTAARQALESGNVNLILPYVPAGGEEELRAAFARVREARKAGGQARAVADLYFFETVVRIHRAGEGAPYTGLKPAGLDEGPVIPVAEEAIETGSLEALVRLLSESVGQELRRRFEHLMHLRGYPPEDVARARAYVEAALGLQVYSHHLYQAIRSDPHEGAHAHPHG
jgi:hypothetical protein